LVAFQIRNRPPAIRIRSRQEKAVSKLGSAMRAGGPCRPRSNTGAVSPTSQAMVESRMRRMTRARLMPSRRTFALIRLRQLVRQDRDEDQIVDAEHDLQHDQRRERGPGLGLGEEGEGLGHDSPCACATGAFRSRNA
jgi:hypothetical protein